MITTLWVMTKRKLLLPGGSAAAGWIVLGYLLTHQQIRDDMFSALLAALSVWTLIAAIMTATWYLSSQLERSIPRAVALGRRLEQARQQSGTVVPIRRAGR